ncbi:MAG: hypothetical protein ACP5I4_01850 [Oceanipulchritudo sp.]|jgi:hypothetical protein
MKEEGMVRWLLVVSVVAVLGGPVVFLLGAMTLNASLIGGTLLLMGALGLFAGMKSLEKR